MRNFTVRLAELPTERAAPEKRNDDAEGTLDGVSVEDLNARAARELGLSPSATGVVVTQIEPGSAAAHSGLKRGDVIQEVNRQPVKNTSDFERAVRNSKDETLLLINREGNTMYLAV